MDLFERTVSKLPIWVIVIISFLIVLAVNIIFVKDIRELFLDLF